MFLTLGIQLLCQIYIEIIEELVEIVSRINCWTSNGSRYSENLAYLIMYHQPYANYSDYITNWKK